MLHYFRCVHTCNRCAFNNYVAVNRTGGVVFGELVPEPGIRSMLGWVLGESGYWCLLEKEKKKDSRDSFLGKIEMKNLRIRIKEIVLLVSLEKEKIKNWRVFGNEESESLGMILLTSLEERKWRIWEFLGKNWNEESESLGMKGIILLWCFWRKKK